MSGVPSAFKCWVPEVLAGEVLAAGFAVVLAGVVAGVVVAAPCAFANINETQTIKRERMAFFMVLVLDLV